MLTGASSTCLVVTSSFVETGEDIYDDPEGLATWLDGWRPDAFDLATAKAELDR